MKKKKTYKNQDQSCKHAKFNITGDDFFFELSKMDVKIINSKEEEKMSNGMEEGLRLERGKGKGVR